VQSSEFGSYSMHSARPLRESAPLLGTGSSRLQQRTVESRQASLPRSLLHSLDIKQKSPTKRPLDDSNTAMAATEIDALNAEAATCLSSSSFVEASKRWSHLLRLILPHLQVPSCATLEEEESDATLSSSGTSDLCLDQRIVYVQQHPTVEEEHVFAAFRCGIVYTSSTGASSSPRSSWNARAYRKVAIATCYNMALSHHLHGLQDAHHAASLEKALTGYRLARSLLESIVSDVSAEAQDVLLLAIAIANNEGHVLASRYDMAGAHECWLDLQWLIQHAVPTPGTLHFFTTAATFPGERGIFSLHAPVA
jgi:hypothetical protein